MDCWWILDAGSDDLKLIMYFIYDVACPNDLINIYDAGTGCTSPQTLRTTSEYQYLSSQNFPEQYSSDSNCRWNIYNPFGIVEVDVIISDMEDDTTPSVCDYDKYQIFD
ncbi:hypothetical protein KUTeg_018342, partial [Tegillarca granosa]